MRGLDPCLDGSGIQRVQTRGWIPAGALAAEDEIVDYNDGTPLTVISVGYEKTTERVYNFEVSGTHTYFAGDVGAWVHNANGFQKAVAGVMVGVLSHAGGIFHAKKVPQSSAAPL